MRARARPARRSRPRLRLDTAVAAASLFLCVSPEVALARPTASRPTPAGGPENEAACRQTVFAGLASDCNLNGGGSEPACCATLRDAERRRCFCSQELVDVVAAVIGEEGLDFFRQFARARCSTRLTEREACSYATANDALFATQVGLTETPPAADYEYEASNGKDTYQNPPGQGVFGTPESLDQGVPQTVPVPSSGVENGFPPGSGSLATPAPSFAFPPFPSQRVPPLAPSTPPSPLPRPPKRPPFGTPGPAPQLSIPPPAPQRVSSFAPPPPALTPRRRKIPGLPSLAAALSSPRRERDSGFFADALKAAGLLRLFDGPGPFTVFVPTNRAWYAALVKLGVTKEDLFEDPALTEVLLHHASRRELFAEDLFFGQKVPTMHMSAPSVSRALREAVRSGIDPSAASVALTETLEVETFQTVFKKAFFVDGCDVVEKNVQGVNGVAHFVDCVLLPPAPQPLPTRRTVAQVIVERFELSIFEQALTGTGLLNAVKQASPTNPLTVFAPTNAAFLKYVATSPGFFVDTAAERLVNPGVPGLQETLLYHFVPARMQSAQLETRAGSALRTFEGNELFVETFASRGGHGRGIFHNSERKLFVNGCRVRAADLLCVDGVVHTVECVLQPNFRDQPEKFFGDTS